MDSEVLVYGCWFPCTWVDNPGSGSRCQENTVHIMADRKQREKTGQGQGQHTLRTHTCTLKLSATYILQSLLKWCHHSRPSLQCEPFLLKSEQSLLPFFPFPKSYDRPCLYFYSTQRTLGIQELLNEQIHKHCIFILLGSPLCKSVVIQLIP